MTMLKLSRQWVGVIQVFMAALLWGTSGSFAKYLFNNNISPFDLAQMRITFSFLILFIFWGIFKRSILHIELKDLSYFIIFGLIGLTFNQFAYLYTISLTNVATAVFLQYMAPTLILTYGLITKTEMATRLKIIALGFSVVGGYLIVVGTTSGLGLSTLGLISGIASAFFFAFYSLYGKYGLRKYNSWTLLTWGFAVGSIVWLFYQSPVSVIFRYESAWLNFIFIAVFATILPFGLFLKGLNNLSAFKAGLIGTLEPVIGAISAFIFLKEVLNFTQIMGGISILMGIILIQIAREPKELNLNINSNLNANLNSNPNSKT